MVWREVARKNWGHRVGVIGTYYSGLLHIFFFLSLPSRCDDVLCVAVTLKACSQCFFGAKLVMARAGEAVVIVYHNEISALNMLYSKNSTEARKGTQESSAGTNGCHKWGALWQCLPFFFFIVFECPLSQFSCNICQGCPRWKFPRLFTILAGCVAVGWGWVRLIKRNSSTVCPVPP